MTSRPDAPAAAGPAAAFPNGVVIIGTGLIGTSIALALRRKGVRVWLADRDPAAVSMAAGLGAGEALPPGQLPSAQVLPARGLHAGRSGADLAVLAVPPDAVAPVLAAAQAAGLAACYTDVASVKAGPLARARALGCELARYVPGHPLAGRERSGPAAARADLFRGRPWALCPPAGTARAAVALVTSLAEACGAQPVTVDAAEHDRWVALVSHAPHVVAAAMAARLADAPAGALALAGQGLRDVTRIAAGDARLWTQILMANAAGAGEVLALVAEDLRQAAEDLRQASGDLRQAAGDVRQAGGDVRQAGDDPGQAGDDPRQAGDDPRRAPAGSRQPSRQEPSGPPGGPAGEAAGRLEALLEAGAAGVARIPGKRGGPAADYAVVSVVIPDQPGELARLFQAAGEAGINIEDVGIEHSTGLPSGVAELSVKPAAARPLVAALAARGWPASAAAPDERHPPRR